MMLKNFTYLLLGILMMPLIVFSQEKESGPSRRAAWERRITKDPQTGLIPLQALENGRNQVEQFYKAAKKSKTTAAIPNVSWKERGPNNVGGRTRAIMWDPQNGTFTPKKKKVWAGGVAGGLWYNNDITDANSSWIKVNDFWDNIAISWIAHDPSNKLILYASTGERASEDNIGNTGQSGTGGGGIWKSIDGGTSWNRLASTIPDYTLILSPDASNRAMNEADSIKVGWREIYKVLVTSTGTVLALTNGGILKSEDKGNTWNRLKGTNAPLTVVAGYQIGAVSDMELGIDNVLYIAEGTNYSPQRMLKSTDGTFNNYEVINIPNNLFSNNEQGRVEIVLAKGTQGANQVIYAVSARSQLSKYAFFVKSVNGGATWTKMTESTFKDDPVGVNPPASVPFFDGQASYDLILGTHNTKPNVLYAGGVQFDMSFDGGSTWMDSVKTSNWRVVAARMHSDHHAFEANPDNNDEAIFGNDGGVYYSNSWSATTTSLVGLGLQARNKNYNVTQYFGVDFHPTANNGLVVGGAQDNGSHAVSSAYNTVGEGLSISTGDGALTFIDQLDPNIVITSYTNITPNLHKTGATGLVPGITPKFSDKGKFINPAEYDSPAHTYYANFTYDAKAPVTGSVNDTLAIRYKIITSAVPADEGYTFTPSFLTYPVNETTQPIKVSFLKLDKTINATSNRVLYIGTSDGDVYKTTAFGIDGNQGVFLTKIMNKATTGTGNVSSIDFGTDNNTIIVTKSNYNIKSVYYSTNANAGINTVWTSKDEATHGLPNIPIRYALINPVDTKQVLLATDLGVWSTTDITATNPDWKETNETLAKVRCDMLKYRASDNTLIVGTHGRGIFSTQLNIGCTPPTAATAGSNSPVTEGSPINLTSSSTGGTSQSWLGSNGYTSTAQNPVIATLAAGVYNYTVTITSSGTCVATATTTVRVNSAPATCTPPTVTAGSNSPITVGGNIFLTATFPNSGIASWVGPNSYTSTGRNPIIAGATLAAAGVYTVTVASPSTSTCTVMLTVNVVVNPVATTCTPPTGAIAQSNSPVTVGSPLSLTSSSTGGTSQQWAGPGGYTSASQSPIITVATAANAGIYTVTITSSGTCTATATTNVVVNAINPTCTPPTLATASSNSPVPVTNQLRLGSSATGGTSYAWAGPNGFTSTLQYPTVSNSSAVTMTGVYTVTIASAAGSACTATATTTVCIAPRVISGPIIFQGRCEGGAITLTTNFDGGDPNLNYQWTRGTTNVGTNSPILNLTNLTATDAGSYSVRATNSCGSVSYGPIILTVSPSPTLAMAGSNSPVAVGAALNLTSSATGGTSYAWAGPNGFTAAVQNPAVSTASTAAMSGVYTVTIGNSASCTATATTMVAVGASVVYVNIANTNTTQNGNTWATAYSNLQTALSSAPANSDFWVAKGVYKPTATTDRNIAFNIPSGAKLYGGFVGTETLISQGNVEGNPTILSGEIGSPSTVNDNSYHVVTFIGASSATILDGFTVMGGNASFNSTRPPSPTNTSTSQPLSIYDGGGIGLDNGSSPTIINCRIISNDAIQGGGLYATNNSNPTVKNSVVMNNQATFGGGIYNLSSSPTYSNILIAGNKATGGAMYNNGSNPTVTNVTIAGNGGYNGAIFNSNSVPVIKNSILWGNISPFNDTQSVTTYSIVEGGYVGIGNLNINPQFVNLVPFGLSPSLSGDYKLTNTSPAIDAGDNGMIGMTDTDLGNFPRRFNNGIVDIGAYEFQGSRMGGTVTSIVSGNWEQGTTWNIGRKPLAGDTVIIDNNHIVTINNDGVMKNIEIRPNATLLYKTSGIKLQSGF